MSTVRIPPRFARRPAAPSSSTSRAARSARSIAGLVAAHPGLESQLLTPDGDLNRFVNAFLNDTDVRHLQALDTPVAEADTLVLLPGDGRGLTSPLGLGSRLDFGGLGDRPTSDDEAFWYEFLTRGDAMEMRARRVLRHLPHGPRCKLCAAPFAGAAAPLMRAIGKRPALKNPAVCNSCFDFIEKHHGGAEIHGRYLFADIRGSTTLAELCRSTSSAR